MSIKKNLQPTNARRRPMSEWRSQALVMVVVNLGHYLLKAQREERQFYLYRVMCVEMAEQARFGPQLDLRVYNAGYTSDTLLGATSVDLSHKLRGTRRSILHLNQNLLTTPSSARGSRGREEEGGGSCVARSAGGCGGRRRMRVVRRCVARGRRRRQRRRRFE